MVTQTKPRPNPRPGGRLPTIQELRAAWQYPLRHEDPGDDWDRRLLAVRDLVAERLGYVPAGGSGESPKRRTPHSEHAEYSVANCIACQREDRAEMEAQQRREALPQPPSGGSGEEEALPIPRYRIGQRVWVVSTKTERGMHPCPDCHGSKTWKTTTAAGETIDIQCPRCTDWSNSRDLPPLAFTRYLPYVQCLTVGSIQIDTAERHGELVKYMCNETGIGSGTVWREDQLHSAEATAHAAAKARASRQQAQSDQTPQALKATDFATLPMRAALALAIRMNNWDAWGKARDYREAMDTVMEAGHLRDEDRETLMDAIEDRPWRNPHPVEALLDAAKAFAACLDEKALSADEREGLGYLLKAIARAEGGQS